MSCTWFQTPSVWVGRQYHVWLFEGTLWTSNAHPCTAERTSQVLVQVVESSLPCSGFTTLFGHLRGHVNLGAESVMELPTNANKEWYAQPVLFWCLFILLNQYLSWLLVFLVQLFALRFSWTCISQSLWCRFRGISFLGSCSNLGQYKQGKNLPGWH